MKRALGRHLTKKETSAFIAATFEFMDVRFKHQGRSHNGVDCAGLVVVSLDAIGRSFRDVPAYSREPLRQGLREALVDNLGDPIPIESMRAGDVALMRFRGEPSHVGIITDHPQYKFGLIHAFAQMKKVVWHGIDEGWMWNIVEVFRP